MTHTTQRAAVVTGASRGLGFALAGALLTAGWRVIVDARDTTALPGRLPRAEVLPGDITTPAHRRELAAAAGDRLDLLVNNASDLGPSPLPSLAELPPAALRFTLETNVVAPLALIQQLLPALRAAHGAVLNISSDAAVEAYPGWGGYGASKAALDHATAVLGVEEPALASYAVDPGDMRTAMHQAAFPGEDISDRPEPEEIVPGLLTLLAARPPSGRYRAADWLTASAGVA